MSSKYGRKPRFDLPWRNYRTIYAVLFTNGIVKVGCTSSMHTRFVALASEARRLHGCDLASIHYGQNIPGARAYRSAEKELLCRMHRIAKPCRKKIEYFEHVSFGVAKNLVDQISSFRVVEQATKPPSLTAAQTGHKRKSREAA